MQSRGRFELSLLGHFFSGNPLDIQGQCHLVSRYKLIGLTLQGKLDGAGGTAGGANVKGVVREINHEFMVTVA